MRAKLLLMPLGLALLCLTACDIEDFGSFQRFQRDFHYSYPLKSGGSFSVEGFNGTVDISGWDQDSVDISGTKYGPTQEAADALQIDIRNTPDEVSIRAVRPSDRRNNEGARFTIKIPRTAVLDRWEQASFIIMTAAVADYHVKNVSPEKIKRKAALELQLEPNPDVLADLGSLRHATGKRSPVLIGFAAETGNLLENARSKLTTKRVDAIVVNDVARSGIGFDANRNEVTIVTTSGEIGVPEASKLEIAKKILEAALRIRQQEGTPVPAPTSRADL